MALQMTDTNETTTPDCPSCAGTGWSIDLDRECRCILLALPVRPATVNRFDAWCDSVARIEGGDCSRADVQNDPSSQWAYVRDFTPTEFYRGFWL